jgi:hypothetical protein
MALLRVNNGSSWITPKSVKRWTGSQWVTADLSYYDGSKWVKIVTTDPNYMYIAYSRKGIGPYSGNIGKFIPPGVSTLVSSTDFSAENSYLWVSVAVAPDGCVVTFPRKNATLTKWDFTSDTPTKVWETTTPVAMYTDPEFLIPNGLDVAPQGFVVTHRDGTGFMVFDYKTGSLKFQDTTTDTKFIRVNDKSEIITAGESGIRKYSPSGELIFSTTSTNNVSGMDLDKFGNIYASSNHDGSKGYIAKVNPSTGAVIARTTSHSGNMRALGVACRENDVIYIQRGYTTLSPQLLERYDFSGSSTSLTWSLGVAKNRYTVFFVHPETGDVYYGDRSRDRIYRAAADTGEYDFSTVPNGYVYGGSVLRYPYV